MKKLQGLGKTLSKENQRKIFGGVADCYQVSCKDSSGNELGVIYTTLAQGWVGACQNMDYCATTQTSGNATSSANCSA